MNLFFESKVVVGTAENPFPPSVNIIVKIPAGNSKENLCLRSNLMLDVEIDSTIDLLIKELEAIRRNAKKQLLEHKKNQ